MQAALGIPETTWHADHMVPFTYNLVLAANAVFAGTCEVALVYTSLRRLPSLSRAAAGDPLRQRAAAAIPTTAVRSVPDVSVGYAGLMSSYISRYSARREQFGYLVLNGRQYAERNPLAVFRDEIGMPDYLAAPMVNEPMSRLDMDVPVDGADAFVVTTTARARDISESPVLLHAATFGRIDKFRDAELDLDRTGQNVVSERLWNLSDLSLSDIDVMFAYDGFSIIAVTWIEDMGYCKRGEGCAYLASSWEPAGRRLLLDGRVPVNTHGGSLSEGGSQGAGHVREAVMQLRQAAGDRQVGDPRSALVTAGAFLSNPTAMILRSDG
jgi:acetyl-CoA acetyltransferase